MGLVELARKALSGRGRPRPPVFSFDSWSKFPSGQPRVLQICHPDWRGVRTVAYGFRTPVIECEDLSIWGEELGRGITEAGVGTVVIQGWPPGSADFAQLLQRAGVEVKCLLHSSPAQHGAESGEAAVVDEILDLVSRGTLGALGMAKSGVPEAFTAAGFPVTYVPNRSPLLPDVARFDLGDAYSVGVFAEPFWRKNVTTQLLAAALMKDATAHVLRKPENRYLDGLRIVEHGELPYDQFISLQASVDLNLYVTLSECHPSTPLESYLTGVPCLISRTSAVFRSDPVLWDLTTVDQPDNPSVIARSAERLRANREEALERARAWIDQADSEGAQRWSEFLAT